jgi:flavin reductase (DIM6/NTAB) family NADH-FMN oxidoreductase RutF
MADEKVIAGEEAFEQLVALLNYPMFVVTTRAGDELAGCLVGFTSQVSIRPPRFLVGLSKRNHTYRVAQRSDHLAVQLLPRRHRELARLFGSETGDRVNKFDRCAWHDGPHDLPVLDDAVGWFAGRVLTRVDAGDHVGFLLEPLEGSAPHNFDELVTFSDVRDLDPGHEA